MRKFLMDIFNTMTMRRCYYEPPGGLFNMYNRKKKCYSLIHEIFLMDFLRLLFLTIVLTYILYRYGVLYFMERFHKKEETVDLLILPERQGAEQSCNEESINILNGNNNNNNSAENEQKENVEVRRSPKRKMTYSSTNKQSPEEKGSVTSSMPTPTKKIEIGTHMTRIVSPRPILCSYCLRESNALNEMGQTIYTFFRCHHFYCGTCLSNMNVQFCPKCRRGLIV